MKQKQVDGLKVAKWMLTVATFLVVLWSGTMWYKFVYLSDDRVFWSAIDNALATNGVTKTQHTTSGGMTMLQRSVISFTPAISSTGYSSSIDEAGGQTDSESVAFLDRDYARYTRLTPRQGQPKFDASDIENTWADTTLPGYPESQTLAGQLTNGALVFVANMSAEKRHEFVKQLRDTKVFDLQYRTGTKVVNGKNASVYKIAVNIDAYNLALAKYLTLIGMPKTAEQVGTSSGNSDVPTFEIAIVPTSRQIVKSGLPTLDATNADNYTSWGVAHTNQAPVESVSIDALNEKVQKLLGGIQ